MNGLPWLSARFSSQTQHHNDRGPLRPRNNDEEWFVVVTGDVNPLGMSERLENSADVQRVIHDEHTVVRVLSANSVDQSIDVLHSDDLRLDPERLGRRPRRLLSADSVSREDF